MEIHLAKSKHWYYKLVGKNYKIVMVSETFLTKWNAKRAAKKLAKLNGFKYTEDN